MMKKSSSFTANRTLPENHKLKPVRGAPRRARSERASRTGETKSWLLRMTLNGKKLRIRVSPRQTLLDFLRIEMGLTGTKGACLEGECGSCYVLVDGHPMNSCLMLVPQVQDRQVVTIEGLAKRNDLHPIQKAFVDQGAVQCGYCTPGLIISTKALLDHKPNPSQQELVAAIEGNLCRCTGYSKILQAMQSAAIAMGKDK